MASSTLLEPMKAFAEPLLQRLDAPALPQEAVPPARAEIGDAQVRQPCQPLHLGPQLRLGARVEHVEREAAVVAAAPRASAAR